MRLLLVEDDRMIGSSLRQPLRAEGHAVDWVYDAVAANAALTAERFDLVLLDLGLPAPASPAREASDLDVLRALRGRGDATPVIVVTARDASGARVTGLDAGADDYLVKLFDIGELNARVRALMRRQAGRAGAGACRRDARPGDAGGREGQRAGACCQRASLRSSKR